MTGDDNHARRFRLERLFDHDPDQCLAAEFGQQLVGTAHPCRAPGRENHRRDIAITVGGKAFTRLRPRYDFHQQAADAHAGEFSSCDLETREQTHQHPIKPILDR